MRFGTRLTLFLIIPIVLALAGYGYLDEQRSRERFRDELRREGRAVTRTVQLSMQEALRDRQLQDVTNLVDEITGFERVYGLRIFDAGGEMLYQSSSLRTQQFRSVEALKEVLATRRPYESQRTIEGQRVLTYIVPLQHTDGSLYGAVQLLQLESFIDEEVRAARNSIVLLTLAMILVTAGTVILATRYVVGRPIESFERSMRAIRPGDTEAFFPERGSYELRRLAHEFNALWGRLEEAHRSLVAEQEERRQAELRLKNAERLAALGRLAAGLAHEIGTPLHVIAGRTDLVRRRKLQGEALDKNLKIVVEQIERITRIVREVLEFARVREPDLAPIDPMRVLSSVLEFMEHRLAEAGIRVELSAPPDLPLVPADAEQLYEVYLNLIQNAVDAMEGGGHLRVTADLVRASHPDTERGPEDFVRVRFADQGTGIPSENLGRVFDPFFTTKGVGKGTGLGMSVSYGIIREHGGWLDVESREQGGTTVTVYLPLEAAGARGEISA